ncbi:hypothetical protein B0T18DRAFT_412033 [Schizothecium vesticola]|uniref:Uncharacterized protein n=1 Tax=Schizothecium vesticola TaxID=314040 RepID=A0AA40K5F1_9PEZI|nr:hypothetical protein B0T18DRAFT_412033 [Schizothecium vesticola]
MYLEIYVYSSVCVRMCAVCVCVCVVYVFAVVCGRLELFVSRWIMETSAIVLGTLLTLSSAPFLRGKQTGKLCFFPRWDESLLGISCQLSKVPWMMRHPKETRRITSRDPSHKEEEG